MRKTILFLGELKRFLRNGLIHFTLILLALIGMQVSVYADPNDPTLHGTGAKPLSQAQRDHIHQHWPRILSVKPNKIGAARINHHLQKLGQNPADIHVATTHEEEFITNKNHKGGSSEELLASWGVTALPSSVNNSQLPCFPPIGDQGQHGACVGFATTYYHATHEYGLLNGINNKTSTANICSPKWTYNMINGGYDGGSYPNDGYNLLNINGATSIANFPYDGNSSQWDLNSADWISALNVRMAPVQFLTVNSTADITTMKSILNNGHAITFTTYAYSWQYTQVGTDPSSSNPYAGQTAISWQQGQDGGHHTTIIGYDDNVWIDVNGNGKVDAGEKGAFLISNSWGTGWANQGFVWISYDAFLSQSQVVNGPSSGRTQIADMLYSMVPLATNYKPKIVAQFSLTQSERNQIAMAVGSSATSTTTPSKTITSEALQQSGGPFAFDGGSIRSLTDTFVLDLTDLLPTTNTTERYYLVTSDVAAGNPTTVNSYTLMDLVNNKQVTVTPSPSSVDNGTIRPYIDYLFSNTTNPVTVNITSPTNGATVSGTISLAANATGTNLARVDFYVDSTLITSDTTSPYLVSVDTTKLSNGAHSFTAIAYDGSGNSANSVVQVTVQNSTPVGNVYINAGGGKVADMCNSSITWQADQYFAGGNAYVTTALPTCLGIYASERYGNFNYKIPVSNGTHNVILQFAEIYFTSAGQRVFNVNINGQQVLSNLDIYALVGFGNPLHYTFPVNVTNGTIEVDFIPVVENPKLSGISVQ